MGDNRARTRAIRARMARTGERFTVAARHHDAERAAADELAALTEELDLYPPAGGMVRPGVPGEGDETSSMAE